MTNAQVFILGIMVAWTPSLIFLAWLLRRPMLEEQDDNTLSPKAESLTR
jgi:hypothetical protein